MTAMRRYTVSCHCERNGARGEYTFRELSWTDAEIKASEAFVEDCARAGARYVPLEEEVETKVVGVGL